MSVSVKNLSCSQSGIQIISNISFSIKTGEILKISGENGSGKTTLLRAISGLSSHNSGEILINKNQVFLLGHNAGIKQNLTVEEDLEFWSEFYQNKHDNFTPIGSFKDKSNRALRKAFGRSYTPEQCSEACKEYDYFSVQDGNECFCENDLNHAKKYGDSNCGPTGGPWCNYIYQNKK